MMSAVIFASRLATKCSIFSSSYTTHSTQQTLKIKTIYSNPILTIFPELITNTKAENSLPNVFQISGNHKLSKSLEEKEI